MSQDSLDSWKAAEQNIPLSSFLECLYLHQSAPIIHDVGSTQPLPRPDDNIDDDNKQSPHRYLLRSHGSTRLLDPNNNSSSSPPAPVLGPRRRSSTPIPQHIPSPTSSRSTDVSKVVHAYLKNNAATELSFRFDSGLIRRIHESLFDLVNFRSTPSTDFLAMWNALIQSQAHSLAISSPKTYEDAQQHPVAEHLHVLVRTLIAHIPFTNSQGRRRLDSLRPEHGTADKSKTCPSDEGCYVCDESGNAHAAYLLEDKRIQVASAGVFQAILSLIGRTGDWRSFKFDSTTEKMEWGSVPAVGSADFLKATRLLTQGYGELQTNCCRRVVILSWDQLIVLQLEERYKVSISDIVDRETRATNRDSFPGTYRKDTTRYYWQPQGSKSTNLPRPTFLSTLTAMTMTPLLQLPHDGYLVSKGPTEGSTKTSDDAETRAYPGNNPNSTSKSNPGSGRTSAKQGPVIGGTNSGKKSAMTIRTDWRSFDPAKRMRIEEESFLYEEDQSLDVSVTFDTGHQATAVESSARPTVIQIPHCGGIELNLSQVTFESYDRSVKPVLSWSFKSQSPPSHTGQDQIWGCFGSGSELCLGYGRLWSTFAIDVWGYNDSETSASSIPVEAQVKHPFNAVGSRVGKDDERSEPSLTFSDDSIMSDSISSPTHFPTKWVAKFAIPDLSHGAAEEGRYTPTDARTAIFNETNVSMDIRQSFPDINVPHVYGALRATIPIQISGHEAMDTGNRFDVYLHLMQRLGEELPEYPTLMQSYMVRRQYDLWHCHGFSHGDPASRHIRSTRLPASAFTHPWEYRYYQSKQHWEPLGPDWYIIDLEAAKGDSTEAEVAEDNRQLVTILRQ